MVDVTVEPTCKIQIEVLENGRRLEAAEARRLGETGYTVTSTITVREDGTDAAANVESKATDLTNSDVSSLTSTLFANTGISVTSVSPLEVQRNVATIVVVPAPSPPPPSPSPPVSTEDPIATPAAPPPPKEGSAGMEGWLIAVIVVVVVIVALVAGLVVYRLLSKRQSSTGVHLDSEKNGFPLAIGASTTQHV